MSFFIGAAEAQRYAQYRPYFHPMAIARAKEAAGLDEKVPLALDVACGTGQSTSALTSAAEQVIGIDLSWNMLANALKNERVRYVRSTAEALPFKSGSVKLVSTALAFHWFDRFMFLQEVSRVLMEEGLLFIYNNGFTGIMQDNQDFQHWSRQVYPERFPTPPRESTPPTSAEAENFGLSFIAEERFENVVHYSPEELAAYLTTQTNVVAAVEEDREKLENVMKWLIGQVRPYFVNPKASFVFASRAWYFRKDSVRRQL